MKTLKNNSNQKIMATTGHCVDIGGSIEIDDATFDAFLKDPYMLGQIRRGNLIENSDPVEALANLNRVWVAGARRAELLEVLEGHGVEGPDINKMKVDELREAVVKLLFVDM